MALTDLQCRLVEVHRDGMSPDALIAAMGLDRRAGKAQVSRDSNWEGMEVGHRSMICPSRAVSVPGRASLASAASRSMKLSSCEGS